MGGHFQWINCEPGGRRDDDDNKKGDEDEDTDDDYENDGAVSLYKPLYPQ